MNIARTWKQIPKPVRLFFLKGCVVFIVWKSLYLFFLLPNRVLDGPLTYAVGKGTIRALNFITFSHNFSAEKGVLEHNEFGTIRIEPIMQIDAQNRKALAVADACNGLELIVLYLGFIVCFPSGISRKSVFSVAGIALIYICNVLRCSSLVLIYLRYPAYLSFSHHYVFTFLVYAFIFYLWYVFTKKPALTKIRVTV
jgi:exosortase/archaeosortase family protein